MASADAKTEARWADPRGAAQALRNVLGQKVAQIVASGGLDKDSAGELAKIGASLAALERAGYDFRTAAVEVTERLAAFASRWEADADKRAWLADILAAFFQDLEEGDQS